MIKSADHAAAVNRLRVSEPQLASIVPFYKVWRVSLRCLRALAYLVHQVALARLKDVYSRIN